MMVESTSASHSEVSQVGRPKQGAIPSRLVQAFSYPKINQYFTFACFAVPTVAGSATSFLFHGGALWCLFEALSGRRKISLDRNALWMTAALWALAGAYVTSALANAERESIAHVAWLCTFLLFPFSYSIWRIANRDDIAAALFWACAAASYGGLALAIVQMVFFIRRAEGGAGNPIVFTTVAAFASAVSLLAAVQSRGWRSIFFYGAFLAGIPSMLLAEVRGLAPAFVFNAVIVAVVWFETISRRNMIRAAATALAVVVIGVSVYSRYMLMRFGDLIEGWHRLQAGHYDTSLGERIAMWREGLRIWEHGPLVGFGPRSAISLIADRVSPGYDLPHVFTHFHNVFVTTLVEAGALGLLCLVGVVVVGITIAVRTIRGQPDLYQKTGASLILLLMSTFLTAGMSSLMIGHDLLNSIFVMSLVVGILLCNNSIAVREKER